MDSGAPFAIALSAFDIAALFCAFGLLACRVAVVPADSGLIPANRFRNWQGVTLALLTLASAGILVSRTLGMNGGNLSSLFTDMGLVLNRTHYGHIWLWRPLALLAAWLAWWWGCKHSRNTRMADWTLIAAVAAVAMTRSDTGHPADHGDFVLAVWMDWIHLLAAATWVGTLFGMSVVVYPHLLRHHEAPPAGNAAVFQRLSTLSGAALLVLLIGGIFNVYEELGPVSSLWTSRYGIVLDVKLAVVFSMLLIGAHNRYIKLPQLQALAKVPRRNSRIRTLMRHLMPGKRSGVAPAQAVRSCARAVLLESFLGLAVIGAAAVLIHAMPPADMPSSAAMVAQPGSSSHTPQRPYQ